MSAAVWFDHRTSELRYALRMIRKTPGASLVAVISLALGIGANTAIFSIADTLLLKLLPVRAPHELYNIARQLPERPSVSWNYPDYCAYRDQNHSFTGMAAYSGSRSVGMQVAGESGQSAEIAYASMVSGNYFEVLGVDPAAGRLLDRSADRQFGASPYAVLAYDYWKRRFAGDPRVIGRTVRLNSYPFTIVGVAARGFKGLDVTASPNIFLPMTMRTEVEGVPLKMWNSRHYWWFVIVGRLAPGATLAKAEQELTTIFKEQVATERRSEGGGRGNARANQDRIALQSGARGYSFVRNTLEKPLFVLMVVVGLVLLIACGNVASVMLARGAARQREIAVRLAVGASRVRLGMQLLVESVVLSLMGGVLGLAFAYACVQAMLGYLPKYGGLQINLQVSPDLRVFGFTFLVSVLTGIVFGLAPALQSTRPDLVPALKDETPTTGGRSRVLLRKTLVIAQVALSLLLLFGAGLFVRTLQNLDNVDVGFSREKVVMVSVDPSRNGYKGQRLRDFYDRLREDVERMPAVRSASLAEITPLAGMRWNGDVAFEGYTWKAGEQKYVDFNTVGSTYFQTLGIPLVLGRTFRETDNPATSPDPPEGIEPDPSSKPAGPRVAIITEKAAKHFFAGRNPVGMHVSEGDEYDPAKAYEIVGVVKDAHYFSMREAAEPMLYLPLWSGRVRSRELCVRTSGEIAPLVEAIRKRVTELDAAVPVLSARTTREFVENTVVVERLIATISGFFALLALLLAAVGLYGVISYGVARRTREIGIRMALGARRGEVLTLVLREAGFLVLVGALIGVPAALVLTRFVKAFLFGVEAKDPATLVAGVALLAVVAAIASVLPARRAATVDPITALRHE